jgi:hypothetical protein
MEQTMSTETEIEAIQKRLHKLERQNRWIKQAGMLLVLIVGAVVVMGQTTASKVVEAERFVLKDGTGKTRGTWDTEPYTKLLLYDESERVTLGLVSYDGKSSGHISIANRSLDTGVIISPDEMVLGKLEEGVRITATSIVLFNKDEKPVWRAP